MNNPADAARIFDHNQNVTSTSQKNRHKINKAMATSTLNDDTTLQSIKYTCKLNQSNKIFQKHRIQGFNIQLQQEQQK